MQLKAIGKHLICHPSMILSFFVFTPEQMDIIRKGFVPKSMDDHCFQHMESNPLLLGYLSPILKI